MPATDAEINEWLLSHIPHRIRSAIAGTEMLVKRLQQRYGQDNVSTAGNQVVIQRPADSVAALCMDSAVWEGRLSATRWLIDFVGITRNKNGRVSRPGVHQHDWRIDALSGNLFPLGHAEAPKLADVWVGCTKSTSHPTHGSAHPPVDPNELNLAVAIVIEHLHVELYQPRGLDIWAVSLTQHPRKVIPET